jgi:hypothetical protein
MSREGENDSYGDIGVLHYGKRFRYSKKDIVVEREEKHGVFEKRDPCTVFHITLYGGMKERQKGSSVQSNRRRNSISYQNLCRIYDPMCVTYI